MVRSIVVGLIALCSLIEVRRSYADAEPHAMASSPPADSDELKFDAAETFTVCIQPLRPYDITLVAPIRRGIAWVYGFSTRVLPARSLPETAWYVPRRRYRADKLLEYLQSAEVMQDGCTAVLGFTSKDISTTRDAGHPDWGVLGLAFLDGPVAVVSSFRWSRSTVDPQRIGQRAIKTVTHELGHVLGLPHRDGGPQCAMNDAGGTIRTVDNSHGTLCASERDTIIATHRLKLPEIRTPVWAELLEP